MNYCPLYAWCLSLNLLWCLSPTEYVQLKKKKRYIMMTLDFYNKASGKVIFASFYTFVLTCVKHHEVGF